MARDAWTVLKTLEIPYHSGKSYSTGTSHDSGLLSEIPASENVPRKVLNFKPVRANSWFVGMATVEVAREDVVRRRADVLNRRDANAVAALYAQDAVSYDPITPEGLKGREAIRKLNENFLKAFQDINIRPLNTIAKGDTVAAEWVYTGRHSGALELPTGTLAPTNRQVTVRVANFYRFNREGLISEERVYWDIAGFLQQLGLKP